MAAPNSASKYTLEYLYFLWAMPLKSMMLFIRNNYEDLAHLKYSDSFP